MQQSTQRLVLTETLHCCYDKSSIFICTSENCKQTAFMCNDDSCQCIKSKHYGCSSHGTKYLINSIENQKKSMTSQNKNAFDAVLKIYQDMIQKISKQKQMFVDFIDMFGLGQNMRKFVSLLGDGRQKEVIGDLAHKVQQQIVIGSSKQKNLSFDAEIINQTWKAKQKEFQEILTKLSEFRYFNQQKTNASSSISDKNNEVPIGTKCTKCGKQLGQFYYWCYWSGIRDLRCRSCVEELDENGFYRFFSNAILVNKNTKTIDLNMIGKNIQPIKQEGASLPTYQCNSCRLVPTNRIARYISLGTPFKQLLGYDDLCQKCMVNYVKGSQKERNSVKSSNHAFLRVLYQPKNYYTF